MAWSGGDDLALKGWDMRMPLYNGQRASIFTTRKWYVLMTYFFSFEGGVTTIQSHPHKQHYWAVGSYDEKIRLFDARNTRSPLSETEVGGGIWRTKWHPDESQKLLLACMHGGLVVLDCPGLDAGAPSPDPMRILTKFQGHNSIAYGCDWERGSPQDHLVYSCSFYDASMHIWKW